MLWESKFKLTVYLLALFFELLTCHSKANLIITIPTGIVETEVYIPGLGQLSLVMGQT